MAKHNHKALPDFFKVKPAAEWTYIDYLDFRDAKNDIPQVRLINGEWKKSLEAIVSCTKCSDNHKRKAKELLSTWKSVMYSLFHSLHPLRLLDFDRQLPLGLTRLIAAETQRGARIDDTS
jgi:hypothetical protein